ncbi:hypothetical protein SKAU_G00146850 [Synaphobranchus kaupii]|uniref:Uncharacterized protein n=1 Tax=Synaphobranchus kaupii TaxID=118154 RepID=A0A9Q1J3U8_SYNKA|nr:hypothetical protein SKAU_G00146850 [Synaphobranchus kaupii]
MWEVGSWNDGRSASQLKESATEDSMRDMSSGDKISPLISRPWPSSPLNKRNSTARGARCRALPAEQSPTLDPAASFHHIASNVREQPRCSNIMQGSKTTQSTLPSDGGRGTGYSIVPIDLPSAFDSNYGFDNRPDELVLPEPPHAAGCRLPLNFSARRVLITGYGQAETYCDNGASVVPKLKRTRSVTWLSFFSSSYFGRKLHC